MFASFEPDAPPKRPPEGVEALAGFAPNKLDVVPDAGGAAGFGAPNKPEPAELPLACVFPPSEKPEDPPAAGVDPKRLPPGGGPAGVVEGREKADLGAGVAAGVDEPIVRC